MTPRTLARRGLGEARRLLRNLSGRLLAPPACRLCGGETMRRRGYGRLFFHCSRCDFLSTPDYNAGALSEGMGLEGSWTGPGGGGYRERHLVTMLQRDLGLRRFLLFGTGNTPTFASLRGEGVDVVGCDISPEVVRRRKAQFGEGSFHAPDALPADARYDGVVAVEVLEHLIEPRAAFALLAGRLAPGGILCGTTNLYPGGPIEDGNTPGYMSHRAHVAYWSLKSLSAAAAAHGRAAAAFEMIRPGSVLPDEKYGQLYPNKRVFFVYEAPVHQPYFEKLLRLTPVLPIDRA